MIGWDIADGYGCCGSVALLVVLVAAAIVDGTPLFGAFGDCRLFGRADDGEQELDRTDWNGVAGTVFDSRPSRTRPGDGELIVLWT